MKTKAEAMKARIVKHGENLLRLFPNATKRDPMELCKALRRIEVKGSDIWTRFCSVPGLDQEALDVESDALLEKAGKLLGVSPDVLIGNRDPRGYFLKVEIGPGDVLHRDMGGYGILAPDLRNEQ